MKQRGPRRARSSFLSITDSVILLIVTSSDLDKTQADGATNVDERHSPKMADMATKVQVQGDVIMPDTESQHRGL